MSSLDLFASTAFGLEAVAIRELENLGYDAKGVQPGRVGFVGDDRAICRVNLWLRSAGRILIRFGEFTATDFGQLFDQTYGLPWENWLPRDACFPVNGRSMQSQLSSVPACQKIVKKAIVERLRSAYRTSELPETGPLVTVDLSLLKDVATLCLDTTGPSLHKRGYRKLVGEAPLKETLAAAMVQLSFWRPDRPLIDPFCGSGTIPIEAAMIARNLAPGLLREFPSEAWPNIAKRLWAEAREEARGQIVPLTELQILGTDIDGSALQLARHHAELAGVGDLIHFQQKDFRDLTSRRKYGCVICNPPYGERIGEEAEVAQLHDLMPQVFARLDTWSFFVLTAFPEFEKRMGRPADRRRKLYNGRIECTYYQYHGPRPPGGRRPERPESPGEIDRGGERA